jgi:hypothetical protein
MDAAALLRLLTLSPPPLLSLLSVPEFVASPRGTGIMPVPIFFESRSGCEEMQNDALKGRPAYITTRPTSDAVETLDPG